MDELAELERLLVQVGRAREVVEAHRVALDRSVLVWWEGVAADRYRALVDERRAALGRAADELGWLEESVAGLVVLARQGSGVGRVVGRAS
ncbi:hypothetical protein [Phycicoccus duodecadis]|uniref:Uncharacterized protein n=1 Tax=Phycicoccus duodecadis TaxID=173053 RepID=A0A2N3YHV6_9MICO|nr:hypothetical protein [Phycicoccus duodecadis]PKW26425.1 hypothetical protein ATL31_1236 [Phycicoccus duodecadis]